jgi:hypothetical protein
VGAFVLFNDSPQELLAVSICVAFGLLAAHEFLIDSTLGHVGRAAFRLRTRTAEHRDAAP